ncbi:MAG TPA: helix-turn-helix domain-containing protein [Gemmatimonadales bacterium]|nr:helix-turn-helix domain-containing protein [Gemmatimonadales bacterium]
MSSDGAFCPVYASIDLLQEKWTLHIIRALLENPLGFNELGRVVGANPTTLAHRLERLERLGILERTMHSVMPPRTSYTLTPAGLALQDVIGAIDRWGRTHLPAPPEEKPRRTPRLTA